LEPEQLSGIALGYGLVDLGFESRQGLGIFLLTTASRPALVPTQPPIQWVPGALSLGLEWPVREADNSTPSSAKLKNAWSYTSTPQYAFMAWCLFKRKHRDSFTFTFIKLFVYIHVHLVPLHHVMVRPAVETIFTYVNILNKQSWTAEKGWYFILGVGRRALHVMARPVVEEAIFGYVNILNKQSWRAENGWYFILGVGRRVFHLLKDLCYKMLHRVSELGPFIGGCGLDSVCLL
jgi:hypothetical protein